MKWVLKYDPDLAKIREEARYLEWLAKLEQAINRAFHKKHSNFKGVFVTDHKTKK